MKGFVGVTDNDWFEFLSKQPDIDEVNFWQPGGKSQFRSLQPGEPFLFKLHKPYQRFIAGGGFFAHSTILPISIAWQAFGERNGAPSCLQMRRLIERRRQVASRFEDYSIGCIILTQPFFFPRNRWIPIPQDFSFNIVQGKGYDLTYGPGRDLWTQVQARLSGLPSFVDDRHEIADPGRRYGQPVVVLPRLGQGSFRVIVTDAYQRRCAVTQEKTLPALEAVHIKPFSESGPHKVQNGLLLRADIHRLFDSGYVTVTTDHHFEVSRLIREEFDNGKEYEKLHGALIELPSKHQYRPSSEFLEWHNENVYNG